MRIVHTVSRALPSLNVVSFRELLMFLVLYCSIALIVIILIIVFIVTFLEVPAGSIPH